VAAGKDAGQVLTTCLCPDCGRMACYCPPGHGTAQPAATLTEILRAVTRRQAGREAGS